MSVHVEKCSVFGQFPPIKKFIGPHSAIGHGQVNFPWRVDKYATNPAFEDIVGKTTFADENDPSKMGKLAARDNSFGISLEVMKKTKIRGSICPKRGWFRRVFLDGGWFGNPFVFRLFPRRNYCFSTSSRDQNWKNRFWKKGARRSSKKGVISAGSNFVIIIVEDSDYTDYNQRLVKRLLSDIKGKVLKCDGQNIMDSFTIITDC